MNNKQKNDRDSGFNKFKSFVFMDLLPTVAIIAVLALLVFCGAMVVSAIL